jgi:putative transposase
LPRSPALQASAGALYASRRRGTRRVRLGTSGVAPREPPLAEGATVLAKSIAKGLPIAPAAAGERSERKPGRTGSGPVYQGRFKSFPIEQEDLYFLVACRYVERNALRSNLVRRARDWRWCSLWARERHAAGGNRPGRGADDPGLPPLLPQSHWPGEARADWPAWGETAETAAALEALRRSARRGTPYGSDRWALRTAQALGLLPTLHPRGRPRRRPAPERRDHKRRN